MLLTMLLAMFGAVGVQGADKATTVRAYVYTATGAGGPHTPEEQGRLDAVKDLRDALGKKKGIIFVTNREDANLLIEVLSREDREEPGAAGPFGGKAVTRMGDMIIRVHLKSGDEESDLKGIGQGTWGRAAKDAADRIVKWIARREPPRPPKKREPQTARISEPRITRTNTDLASHAGLSAVERAPFPVTFRGELLGDFFADIVINARVLVEVKATGALSRWDEAQTLNYLRASRLEVGLILNFGPKREHWRRILTNDRKIPNLFV